MLMGMVFMDTKIAIKTLAEYALEQILKLVRVFQQRRSWIENTQGFFFLKCQKKKTSQSAIWILVGQCLMMDCFFQH